MRATFHHAEKQTDSITSFWFEPERPMQFTAGQFTELTIEHADADSRGIKRWFTIASSPSSELIGITTKFAGEDKSSSFKKALFGLQVGTEVKLEDAMGDFVLPKLLQTPLVFVAGGIGITPFHSMLQWIAETGEDRPIKLIYAVQSEDDILFQDTFSRANTHATIVVSEPSAAWGGERGRITGEMILGLEKPSEDSLIYLSGPEPMLEALQADLLKQGVKQRQLVTDFFPGYSSL